MSLMGNNLITNSQPVGFSETCELICYDSQQGARQTGCEGQYRNIERTNTGFIEGKTIRVKIVGKYRLFKCTNEEVEIQRKILGPRTKGAWIREDGDARQMDSTRVLDVGDRGSHPWIIEQGGGTVAQLWGPCFNSGVGLKKEIKNRSTSSKIRDPGGIGEVDVKGTRGIL